MIQVDNAADTRAILDAFHSRGYHDVDTGRNYPGSELRLGEAGAASDLHLTIHTKVADQYAGAHRADKIRESIDASLAELKTSSVETLYLHVPDRTTPFEESARAVNDAIKEGKAKHFGLSNYAPEEVQRFVEICEKEGLVKPSVYEGNYNAFTRQGDDELFPILRRHGIAFVAYSPAAGGILSGHKETSHRWGDKVGAIVSRP